jgi:hypothetical protein
VRTLGQKAGPRNRGRAPRGHAFLDTARSGAHDLAVRLGRPVNLYAWSDSTMTRRSRLALAAFLLTLAGCASVPTKVDTGPIRAATFNFVDGGVKPAPDYADNRETIHAMIQEAITRNLAARGVKRVPKDGDVTVAYLVILGDNVSTRSINDYFGYSDDTWALQEKAQKAYTGTGNPNSFEAGTLLIDIIDNKGYKVRLRNYVTRSIIRQLPADARAARIQGVVDDVLKGARIGP